MYSTRIINSSITIYMASCKAKEAITDLRPNTQRLPQEIRQGLHHHSNQNTSSANTRRPVFQRSACGEHLHQKQYDTYPHSRLQRCHKSLTSQRLIVFFPKDLGIKLINPRTYFI